MLRGHSGAVTGLAFDSAGSGRVYSCSEDRSLRGWDPTTGSFAEALYGHTAAPTAVAPLRPGRLVSTGGQERAARAWKLEAETQLVFRGPGSALTLDCVAGVLGGRLFVTGGQDGSMHLWTADRKKPISSVKAAHAGPLVSLASLPGTDLLASGSSDGLIRLWRVVQPGTAAAEEDDDDEEDEEDEEEDDEGVGGEKNNAGESDGAGAAAGAELLTSGLFREVARVPAAGFVNGLAFAGNGSRLVAAVGCEHRMGRWWRLPRVKPGVVVVDLPPSVAEALSPNV